MTSKSNVGSQAVKARKILAPDAKLKAQMKARRAAVESAHQMKVASQANVDAIKAINARERKEQQSAKNRNTQPVNTSADNRKPPSSRPRNLKVTSGASDIQNAAYRRMMIDYCLATFSQAIELVPTSKKERLLMCCCSILIIILGIELFKKLTQSRAWVLIYQRAVVALDYGEQLS